MKGRTLTLFGFSVMFGAEIFLSAGAELTFQDWVVLGFAASMIGRAVAYLAIFEWLRKPFTKLVPHSSGAGEDYHPKWNTGARSAIGELLTCPVCSGAWGAAVLVLMTKYFPAPGKNAIYILGAAALAWLISWATEYLEWAKHNQREQVGLHQREEPVNWDTALERVLEDIDNAS